MVNIREHTEKLNDFYKLSDAKVIIGNESSHEKQNVYKWWTVEQHTEKLKDF